MQKYHKNLLLCGSNLTIMEDDNFCSFTGHFVLESDSEVVINDLMTPSHFHLKSVLGRRPLKFSLVLEG